MLAMADKGIGTSPNLLKAIECIGMRRMTRARGELAFRDCKSGGWRGRKSGAPNPESANILWLAKSAAHVRMPSLGAIARFCQNRDLRDLQDFASPNLRFSP